MPAVAAAILVAHVLLAIDFSRRHSAVFDEVVYPTSGYAYLTTGDYRMNPEHPPFLKLWTGASWIGIGIRAEAIPGWAEGDQWGWGMTMLYGEGMPHRALLLRARAMITLLSAILAVAIFLAARRLAGDAAGLAALALYAFDPLVVAHAGLAVTDLGGAAFYFFSAISFSWAIGRGGPWRVAGAGALLGLALGSKFSNVAAIAILAAVAAWEARGTVSSRVPWIRAGGVLLAAAAVGAILYGPAGPGLWLQGIGMLGFHDKVGHPSYAFGVYSQFGRWWYFPLAWCVKTPVPLIVSSLAGIGLAVARVRREPRWCGLLLLGPVLVWGPALASSLNLGVRHLLPAVPFLAVAGGWAVAEAFSRGLAARLAGVALLAWLCVGTIRAHPDELAYANELSGGPATLWRKLADSSVDWGQDLPALAREIGKAPLRRLYLGYFGTADPAAYGLRYHTIPSMRMIERRFEDGGDPDGREWIAISVTNLLDVYGTAHDGYAWLRDRPMTAFPGNSIALYDITGDAEAHRMLGEEALRYGDPEAAGPPLRRASELAGRP